MAINFPDSPSVNDTHTVSDRTWIWTGTVWNLLGTIGPAGPTNDYVNGITAGTGVSVSGTPLQGWSPTVSIGQSVSTTSSPTFSNMTLSGAVTASGGVNVTDGTSNVAQSVSTLLTTTTASDQVIDSSAADALKYVVHVSDGADSQVSEFLITNDGSTPYFTQYGNICTAASDLSTFDVGYSAGSTQLLATPASANLTFKIFKNALT